jgi:hypothetical protein
MPSIDQISLLRRHTARRQSVVAVSIAAIIAVAVSQLVAPDATAATGSAGQSSTGGITIKTPTPDGVVPRGSLAAAKVAVALCKYRQRRKGDVDAA